MVQTPTRTNDASMEMMAVRIMTQSLFPRIFLRVCVSLLCMFHRTTGTLYFWAMHRYQSTRRPGTSRSISWLRMETKGLHNPHRLRSQVSYRLSPSIAPLSSRFVPDWPRFGLTRTHVPVVGGEAGLLRRGRTSLGRRRQRPAFVRYVRNGQSVRCYRSGRI